MKVANRLCIKTEQVMFECMFQTSRPGRFVSMSGEVAIIQVSLLNAISASLLSHEASNIGQMHGRLCRDARLIQNQEPDAQARLELLRFPLIEECIRRVQERVGQCHGLRPIVPSQQCTEFITAQPPKGVPYTEDFRQMSRDCAKHAIARSMTAGVIDDLEAVEIKHQQHVTHRGIELLYVSE